jgi:glycosyltransferase involved in cell wall biosynthesis
LPEVGGEAAAYFEPGDDQELAKIMLSITEESGRAAKLRELGINRASQFTWQKTASAMAAVYRRTIGVE